jgi:hypothetical protein
MIIDGLPLDNKTMVRVLAGCANWSAFNSGASISLIRRCINPEDIERSSC